MVAAGLRTSRRTVLGRDHAATKTNVSDQRRKPARGRGGKVSPIATRMAVPDHFTISIRQTIYKGVLGIIA